MSARCRFPLALLALSTLLIAMPALAQNRYYPADGNGVGLSVTLGQGGDFTQLGAAAIVTMDGRLDLGLEVARATFDAMTYGDDFSSFVFSPGLGLAVLRPRPEFPLGLEFNLGYALGSFSSPALDYSDVELTSEGYSYGCEAYWLFLPAPDLRLLPSLGVGYASVTTKLVDRYDRLEETVEDVVISGSLGLLFNRRVFLTPAFAVFDGETTFGISLGALLTAR